MSLVTFNKKCAYLLFCILSEDGKVSLIEFVIVWINLSHWHYQINTILILFHYFLIIIIFQSNLILKICNKSSTGLSVIFDWFFFITVEVQQKWWRFVVFLVHLKMLSTRKRNTSTNLNIILSHKQGRICNKMKRNVSGG